MELGFWICYSHRRDRLYKIVHFTCL